MLKPRSPIIFGVAMSDTSWLWALFTVIAAAAQTVRNAAQRELTATLGTVGATHVRFLFGFPFALIFLAIVLATGGVSLPQPSAVYWTWVLDGALTQIAATALMPATFTLAIGLLLQSGLLSLYLAARDRAVLTAIVRAWRPSLLAGFLGALASQFWFLAFALASAANVRTLALIEVLFAQAISRFVFQQATTPREAFGIVLIVIGVALLIWAH